MEIYINECSLTGQYFSEAEFSEAVKTFVGIFVKVNEKKLTTYKNSSVLLHRKALLESIFTSSFEQIRDKSLKLAFGQIVFNRTNPKDWTLDQKHSLSDDFICLIIDDFVEGTVLAEVAERNLQDENEMPRLLINFKNSPFDATKIHVFKDDETFENPIVLDCIDNQFDFDNWLSLYEKAIRAKEYLVVSGLFRKTNSQLQGQSIYQHNENGQYWYLDNFHKNHFEVFNAHQEHIGVADLEGNLDMSKKVNGRTIGL